VEESLTSGRIEVVCGPEAAPVLERLRAEFVRLYPEARVQVRVASSREAVRALFAAESDLAVLTRDLEDDERAAAVRGGLELEGFRFARDAVVAVVHPANRLENLALDELRGIYQGRIRNWSELGGEALAIEPVVSTPGGDLYTYFEQRVMNSEPVTAPAVHAGNDSAVAARVARTHAAIGFVSLAAAGPEVRALRISSLSGLPYWRPDPEAVYRGDYPLTRFFHLYARTGGRPLANGLITFVTSREGQAIVREAGLIPTTVPVRFVRRSPMLGSH
jgi:phosphate transport system substrate-binding protein